MIARELAKARIAKGRRGKLKAFDYYKPGDPASDVVVFCKKCGCPLVSYVPHERLRVNGMPLAVMAETNMYAELEIEFDDGSKHATPVCKTCIESISGDDIEAMYAADMASWERTAPETTDWDRVSGRRMVKHRRIR